MKYLELRVSVKGHARFAVFYGHAIYYLAPSICAANSVQVFWISRKSQPLGLTLM
jgi:hypothetical protein